MEKIMDNSDKKIAEFYAIYFSIGDAYEKLAKKFALTSTSLFILDAIHSFPNECTQRFICEKLQYPKQTVNTVLNSFEKEGYLIRIPMEKDKRNKLVCLTDKGKIYTSHIINIMNKCEKTAFQSLSDKEMDAMINAKRSFLNKLSKMIDNLENDTAEE